MNDLFLRACRRERVERTPVWIMRQAGRYLPGYRAAREKAGGFVALTKNPALAAEVTLEPVERFGLDAAILFADILTPVMGAGIEVEFAPGPVVKRPVAGDADLEPLRAFDAARAVPETLDTVRRLVPRLPVPLIGFAGAPFTLACYLVEGHGSKEFEHTRALLYRDPAFAGRLLDALVAMTADYLEAQVRAGAAAVQVFDTWAGLLSPGDFARFLAPGLRRIFQRVRGLGVPSIYYVNGGGALLPEIGTIGADVAGIDWRTPLDRARAVVPATMVVQGNLDPMVLLGPADLVRERAREVLRAAGGRPGHVFNLGHGIHHTTDPENVAVLVETVRKESAR